jgi:S-adenosylmethionine decarboxylase
MQKIAGTHLIIDAYVRNPNELTKQHIKQHFDRIVKELEMQFIDPIKPMLAVDVPLEADKLSTDDDEGGISVIAPITTSHLSAHAWPLRGAIMLDIFSCKPFDAEHALSIIDHLFGFSVYRHYIIDRIDPHTQLL